MIWIILENYNSPPDTHSYHGQRYCYYYRTHFGRKMWGVKWEFLKDKTN